MVRKRRTELPGGGETSESPEGVGGRGGAQRPPAQPPVQQGGVHQGGGRGWGPQSQHGGRGGRGGGGPQRGGMAPQQHYGGSSEYHQQGRGAQPRGGAPQQRRGGAVGSGRGIGPSAGGPSRPPVPELTAMGSGHGIGPSAGGPSRSPVSELHQATEAPYQAGVTGQPVPYTKPSEISAEASSSSQVPEPSNLSVVQQFQQLSVQAGIPSTSKSMRFPLRPGKGSTGIKCIVKANHFFAELPDKDLHQYDVTISPEVPSRGVNRVVMEQLVKIYRESHLGKRLPAYDGRKSLYTAGPLPFISKEFKITLSDDDDGSGGPRREREFKVVIKFAARADLHHLELFLQGRQTDAPQEALQVLDIVLRELPTKRYCPVGRSFYAPGLGRRQSLGDGLESWRGFYQSIRPTQMGLSLNIDMSSTAFIEPLPVIDFVTQLLNRDVSMRPLSDADRVKIKKALRGVRVEVTHRGNMRRKYRISGLTPQATRELMFPVDERGTMKSVVEYFHETYGFVIQHTQWPCLQVGNQQRPNYLPMEVCKIVEGQRYSKRLNERQITALLKVTCQRPQEREHDILRTVHHNAYSEDPYAKEFGIKISDRLASVEARVLPPPWLKYHDTGREKDCLPQVGQWNMMNKLDRVSTIAAKYIGRPISQLPPVQPIQITSLDLSMTSTFGAQGMMAGPSSLDLDLDLLPGSSSTTASNLPFQALSITDMDKSLMVDVAGNAMDEFIRLVHNNEPVWMKSPNDGKDILNLDTYERLFPRGRGMGMGMGMAGGDPLKNPNIRIEASRDSGVVIMNGLALVDMFMDSNKWVELFPTIVSKARTLELIAPSGMLGTQSSSLQLLYEELQVLSPLAPTRQFYLLRFCQQIEQGSWAIVNVSFDLPQSQESHSAFQVRCHKLPSGCLIQDLPNGYSKVTWVEHVEIDEKTPTHRLLRDLIYSGFAFGAERWLSTLQRMCERFACLMVTGNSTRDLGGVIPSPDGKRSMMKLAQRMVSSFCASINPCNGHQWTTLTGLNEVEVRASFHKSTDPGQPSGVVLSAATTIWLPVSPQNVFNFFRDERTRPQWDVLFNGNAVEEVAHIANGSHPGNCISVLRAFNGSQNNMLILQESCIDSSGSLVVYCPVDLPAIHIAMSGEDPSYIPLLPSGFTILPDGHYCDGAGGGGGDGGASTSTSSNAHGGSSSSRTAGSLITVVFQILVSSLPSANKMNPESVTTVNNLIGATVQQIKAALNCPPPPHPPS